MTFRLSIFSVLVTLFSMNSFAQPTIGEWTDYQSYSNAFSLADTGTKIYCATAGGLFMFDKTDNSIRKFTRINGLSDVGIQKIDYSKENDIVLVAYQNANIDLIIGNKVFNLSDIKRKQISADKTINNITFFGKSAYLSCGFGIVVVNLDKKEIKDTYLLGADGGYLSIFDLAADDKFFYAATKTGIYKASITEPFLQNYNNWKRETTIPNSNGKFSKIKLFNGKIIANFTKDEWAGDSMYQLNGNIWSPYIPEIKYVSDVSTNSNFIVFSSREEVSVYNEKAEKVKSVAKYQYSSGDETGLITLGAVLDNQNILWIADKKHGLVKVGSKAEKIMPDGPVDNMIFSIYSDNNDVWISSGGRTSSWDNIFNEPRFQRLRDGKWTVFDKNTFPTANDFRDIVCVVSNPKNPENFFAGSWGGGVIEFSSTQKPKVFNNFNSSLQTQVPAVPEAPYVRIGGMAFDSKNNLWVTNSGVGKVLSVRQADGNWKSFDLAEIANKFTIGKIVITPDDDKWILLPRGNGLYVYNSDKNQGKLLKVVAKFVNSEGPFYTDMNNVQSIAVDKKGEIWVGTTGGVAVYSSPNRIWTESILYASRPGLDIPDGKFHPLLEKESITAIAIDGANRKWFGTKNSGVFLISENGTSEIENFNNENSPLPSNEIVDIGINNLTGEVFIGTSAGLISYMGVATKGNDEFNDVYVYPNPVRENYDGPIIIKGLLDDTDVKITNVSGNLVYKTKSLGGQAIWDGRNLNGNKCKTGVYMVFLSNSDGTSTKVTKLLLIN